MNDSAFPFSFLGFMKNASAKQTIIIFVSKLHCRFKSFKRKIFQKWNAKCVCMCRRNFHSFVMQINMFVLKCTGTLLLLGPYGALSVDARLENCKQWSCLRECWIFTTSIIAQIEFNEAYSFLMKWGRNLYSIQVFFQNYKNNAVIIRI